MSYWLILTNTQSINFCKQIKKLKNQIYLILQYTDSSIMLYYYYNSIALSGKSGPGKWFVCWGSAFVECKLFLIEKSTLCQQLLENVKSYPKNHSKNCPEKLSIKLSKQIVQKSSPQFPHISKVTANRWDRQLYFKTFC